MDDDVRSATRRWVEADLIDAETAEAIVAHERDRPGGSSTDRVTAVVAIMGALLVAVGLIAGIAATWDALDDVARSVLLVAAPVIAAAAGVDLDRRGYTRAGTGCWILSAVLVGPSLFLLADIHRPQLAGQWVTLAWGAIALPMGHTFRTRIGTAIGLVALLLALGLTGDGQTGLVIAGAMGAVIAAAAVALRPRTPELVDTYRVCALGPVIITLLWFGVTEGRFETLDVSLSLPVGVAFLLALAAMGAGWWSAHSGGGTSGEAGLIAIPFVGTVLGVGIVLLGDHLPAIIGFLLVQALLLLTLLAAVAVGVALASSWLINVVAIGFLFQVLSLLVTLMGELSGALALVIAGTVLLLVAVGLERGRRRILARFQRSD